MKNKLSILLIILLSSLTFCEVKLPRLISDGMVLQRNTELNIWGWADKNEKVTINFLGSSYNTTADNEGNWKIVLSDLKAGGPYQMQINSITINDILVGDVLGLFWAI
jgi:sialate O-acetylesterase